MKPYTQAGRNRPEVSKVQEKKNCLHNERRDTWRVDVVRWPGCPAEHRGSLDLLAPPFASRQKVEKNIEERKNRTRRIFTF
jgi:hypothetical protein